MSTVVWNFRCKELGCGFGCMSRQVLDLHEESHGELNGGLE